jgi:hypothetical protein
VDKFSGWRVGYAHDEKILEENPNHFLPKTTVGDPVSSKNMCHL